MAEPHHVRMLKRSVVRKCLAVVAVVLLTAVSLGCMMLRFGDQWADLVIKSLVLLTAIALATRIGAFGQRRLSRRSEDGSSSDPAARWSSPVTIVAILTVIVTAAGVYFADQQSVRASRAQITERIRAASTALAALGPANATVREGGLVELGQLMADAPQLQPQIVAMLDGFLREHLRDVHTSSWKLPADIRAAIISLGRRDRAFDQGHRADLSEIDLTYAELSGLNMRGADLSDAKLAHAILRDADLSDTVLSDADLRNVDLRGADLEHCYLENAKLDGADLRKAYLRSANLRDTQLRNGKVAGADLTNVDLTDAALAGTDLRNADTASVKR